MPTDRDYCEALETLLETPTDADALAVFDSDPDGARKYLTEIMDDALKAAWGASQQLQRLGAGQAG